MKRSSTQRSIALLALTVSISFVASLQPAHAQYFYNLPYYLGSSLMYPLSRALFGGGGNIYNMTNPYYLTNRFVNGSINSSGIFRAPGYGPMPMGVAGYSDEEPLNSPRQRNRPFRYGQWGYDQTSYAGGYIQPNPDAVVPQNVGQPGAPGMPAILPGQATQPPPQLSTTMPPVAPSRVKHGKKQRLQQQQLQQQQLQQQQMAAAQAGSNQFAPSAVAAPALGVGGMNIPNHAPLAQGFVSMVNTKYDGDISKALFSADGRSWARTVGLIDNHEIFGADLSAERVGVIGKIFKDPGLDPASKLEAAKILLRTSAPATAVAGTAK